jgi:hypothetical protein
MSTTPLPQTTFRPVITREREMEDELEHGEPVFAHIVRPTPGQDDDATAKVLEARIYGTPLEALCGHRWIPSRDPSRHPLCSRCKEIYELYRAMGPDLPETPRS